MSEREGDRDRERERESESESEGVREREREREREMSAQEERRRRFHSGVVNCSLHLVLHETCLVDDVQLLPRGFSCHAGWFQLEHDAFMGNHDENSQWRQSVAGFGISISNYASGEVIMQAWIVG